MAILENVVIRDDLGRGLNVNDAEQKINVKPDNTTVIFNADDELAVNVASIVGGLPTVVQSSSITMGGGSVTLTHNLTDGTTQDLDLTELAKDVNVTGGTFDASTLILTLFEDEGGNSVNIDLAALSQTYTQDSDTVTFSGDGSESNPLSAKVILANDTLIADATGLALNKPVVFDVELKSLFGTRTLGYISSTNTI